MNSARPSNFTITLWACFRGDRSLSPNYDDHGDPSGSGLPGAGHWRPRSGRLSGAKNVEGVGAHKCEEDDGKEEHRGHHSVNQVEPLVA